MNNLCKLYTNNDILLKLAAFFVENVPPRALHIQWRKKIRIHILQLPKLSTESYTIK